MRVTVQPRVNGFAHAADLVQRWCVVVWPAKLQNLGEVIRTKRRERTRLKEGLVLVFHILKDVSAEVFVPCGLTLIVQPSARSG